MLSILELMEINICLVSWPSWCYHNQCQDKVSSPQILAAASALLVMGEVGLRLEPEPWWQHHRVLVELVGLLLREFLLAVFL